MNNESGQNIVIGDGNLARQSIAVMRHPINRRHLRPRVRRRNGNHRYRDAIYRVLALVVALTRTLLSHTPAERLRHPYAASPTQADQRVDLVLASNRQGLGNLE